MLNLFLDESGDHSLKIIDEQYPIFVLAGCLFEDKYYRSSDPYEICFEFIMERGVMFAQRRKETVEMSFESRDDYSNTELLNLYEKFKLNGSSQIKPSEIKKHILNISFPSKSANIIGHQIADLVAYPIARRILNPDAENPFFNILLSKFVRGKLNKIDGYGLKIFPKMRLR